MSLAKEVREWIVRVKDHRYLDELERYLTMFEQAELDLRSVQAEVTKQSQILRELQASVVAKEGKLAGLDKALAASSDKLAKQVAVLSALSKVDG